VRRNLRPYSWNSEGHLNAAGSLWRLTAFGGHPDIRGQFRLHVGLTAEDLSLAQKGLTSVDDRRLRTERIFLGADSSYLLAVSSARRFLASSKSAPPSPLFWIDTNFR
jgi:hypothetical protein